MKQELDGAFRAVVGAEVYCRAPSGQNLGDIPDARLQVSVAGATGSQVTIDAVNAPSSPVPGSPNPNNPRIIGPFNGTVSIRFAAPSDILPPGISTAPIGIEMAIVTGAWGGPLTDPSGAFTLAPGTFGNVVAQTPELGSLALFGAGAAGMAGYAITRLRGRRKAQAPSQ
jgi:hypothetical protein